MNYDFDTLLDRAGTNSVKWQFVKGADGMEFWDATDARHGDQQVLPMWVADMDFQVAPEVAAAIRDRAAHTVFGYAQPSPTYRPTVCEWQRKRNNWQVAEHWVTPVPGIVPAMHLFVRRFTDPGDSVLIQRPVYHPFTFAAENNGRNVVSSALKWDGNHYVMDYDDLAQKAADPRVKVALLCSPHNPVGRVWTAEELNRYAEICAANDVTVFADEIHSDLIMPGNHFVAYGTVEKAKLAPYIVGTAPSKSFNLAGLKTGNLIIADAELQAEFLVEQRACGLMGTNPFGIVALEAAYNHGEPWLEAAIQYIAANVRHLDARLQKELPAVSVVEPQGTYLVWLDMRKLGLDGPALGEMLMNKARLYLDEGQIFGPEGEGYARINVACPRRIMDLAIDRLVRATA
jgi:cysteine-S-conjugate beta-lyase